MGGKPSVSTSDYYYEGGSSSSNVGCSVTGGYTKDNWTGYVKTGVGANISNKGVTPYGGGSGEIGIKYNIGAALSSKK